MGARARDPGQVSSVFQVSHPQPMTAPALVAPAQRRCPACAAPVSDRARVCAFCDAVIDPSAPEPAPAPGARSRATIGATLGRMLRALVVIAGVLLVLALLLVGWFGHRVSLSLEQRARRADAQASAATAAAGWLPLDSAVRRAAAQVGAGAAIDLEAAAALSAMNRRGNADDAWWRSAPAAPVPAPMVRPDRRSAALAALPGRIAPAFLDSLARDTMDARLAAWRRVARSAPLPVDWLYDPARLAGERDPMRLPTPRFAATKELGLRNTSAAILALAHGDARTAALRLRENVAVGGQLMRGPSMIQALIGRTIARDAVRSLRQVARVARDSALARETAALDDALQPQQNGYAALRAAPLHFADPADPSGPALIGDRSLPAGARLELLSAVSTGACLNTRELFLGVDEDRLATMARARAALTDLPGAETFGAIHARWLDDLVRHPAQVQWWMPYDRRQAHVPWAPTAGLRARMLLCMRML